MLGNVLRPWYRLTLRTLVVVPIRDKGKREGQGEKGGFEISDLKVSSSKMKGLRLINPKMSRVVNKI